jgi:predicted NBD/HSP70 family sugar kinase
MKNMQRASAPDIDQGAADHLRPRGSNQTGMRQFNERVVLQAIRLHGSLPKAELARITKLSAQTVSLIIDRLSLDALVHKLAPLRGKIGQPSVPIALNPDGALSIGVKIGRRSLDILLLDFVGTVRMRASLAYPFPEPEAVFEAIAAQVKLMKEALGPALAQRLQGIGVAAPLSLSSWQHLLGIESGQATSWDGIDIATRITQDNGLPVQLAKDTAAACVAELVSGHGRSIKSFLYMFVDTFIGGGLVIDSHLHAGLHGNAGAIGSMPMGLALQGRGTAASSAPAQMLSTASLRSLETLFEHAALDPGAAYDERALQAPWRQYSEQWLEQAAASIAMTANNATCLLDLEGIIIDGSFCRTMLERLMQCIAAAMERYDWEGIVRPTAHAGTIGPDARALGGALLPLYANFAPDHDLFLKL